MVLDSMKIVEAKPVEDCRLSLRFDDGTSGIVDLSSIAGVGVFSDWAQPGVFQQVRVSELGGVEWPGELDLCPDSLYLKLTGKSPEDLFPLLHTHLAHA